MQQFKEFQDFSAAEVALWLAAQGLGHHIHQFLHLRVDGALLSRLAVEDLVGDLGLSGLHAKKVKKNIDFTQRLSADTALLNKKIETLSRENEGLLEQVAALEDALKVRNPTERAPLRPLEPSEDADGVPVEETAAETSPGDAVKEGAQLSPKELQASGQYCWPRFEHDDGHYRRVPPDWKFPSLPLQEMYTYWHCGDVEKEYPPMKFLERRDVIHISKRASTSLSEIRRVMTVIDDHAKSKGMQVTSIMTPEKAHWLFASGEDAIMDVVSAKTDTGRKRQLARLKHKTVLRYLIKKRRRLREEEPLVSDQVSGSVVPDPCETDRIRSGGEGHATP